VEISRVLKVNFSIYIKQDLDNLYNMMTILNNIADYKNIINWKNHSQGQPKNNYNKFAEVILFYTKGKPIFNTYAEKRRKPDNYWSGCGKIFKGKMTNLWDDIKPINSGCIKNKEAELDIKTNKKLHSCQMPIALVKRCINFSSNENNIILDPFLGSGTVAVAYVESKRKYIGIDNNKEYVEIAERRIKAIPETLF
jgi:DNA modification methylase